MAWWMILTAGILAGLLGGVGLGFAALRRLHWCRSCGANVGRTCATCREQELAGTAPRPTVRREQLQAPGNRRTLWPSFHERAEQHRIS